MAGISFGGLASGIDSEAMIAGLMQIERAPRARMELNAGRAQARDAALRDVLAKLKGVSDAAAALRSAALWSDVQTVESADPTKVSARRLSGTGPGGYAIQVSQLARAEQRTYDFTPSAGAAQIAVGAATIDLAPGATLADAVAAINAEPDGGVYAVAVGGRLVLASRQTGAANGFVATSSTLAEDGALHRPGLDAQFAVDGVAQTSASNTVTGAVPGLELTLRSLTATPVTVSVGAPGPDADAIKAKLKAFVDQYNGAVDAIRTRLSEKRVPNATTQADANKGVLFGDTMLTGLLGSLRQVVSESGLRDLGIGTGAPGSPVGAGSSSVAGKLTFDDAKLAAALQADPAAVRATLAGTGGFAAELDELLAPKVGAGGAFADRLDAAAGELQRVRDTMSALDRRLEDREARLRAQFATLEKLLSQSQSQGQWLSGQLAGLAK